MALKLAERFHEETDPEHYHQASWAILRQPYLNAIQYHFATCQAEAACRLAPERTAYKTSLGVARYRAGQYQEALESLTQAGQGNKDNPAILAFLVAARYRLHQRTEAEAELARLHKMMKTPEFANDQEASGFLREAEAVIRAKASEHR